MKEFNNCEEAFSSGETTFKVLTDSKNGSLSFIITNGQCYISESNVDDVDDVKQIVPDFFKELQKYNLSYSHLYFCDENSKQQLEPFFITMASNFGVNYQGEKEITDIIED